MPTLPTYTRVSKNRVRVRYGARHTAASRKRSFHDLPWPLKNEKGAVKYATDFAHACMFNLGKKHKADTVCVLCGQVFRHWPKYLAENTPEGDVSMSQTILMRHTKYPGCIVAHFAKALKMFYSEADEKTKVQTLVNASLQSLRNTVGHLQAISWAGTGYVNVSPDPGFPIPGCLGCKAVTETNKPPGHQTGCAVDKMMTHAKKTHMHVEIPNVFFESYESRSE